MRSSWDSALNGNNMLSCFGDRRLAGIRTFLNNIHFLAFPGFISDGIAKEMTVSISENISYKYDRTLWSYVKGHLQHRYHLVTNGLFWIVEFHFFTTYASFLLIACICQSIAPHPSTGTINNQFLSLFRRQNISVLAWYLTGFLTLITRFSCEITGTFTRKFNLWWTFPESSNPQVPISSLCAAAVWWRDWSITGAIIFIFVHIGNRLEWCSGALRYKGWHYLHIDLPICEPMYTTFVAHLVITVT